MTAFVQKAACLGLLLAAAALAAAQAGIIDQQSPQDPAARHAAWFTLGTGLIWQQQVQVGVGGALTGVEITSGGMIGSTIDVKIRPVGAWSQGPVLAQRTVQKTINGYESHRLDLSVGTSPSPLLMPAGLTFVIEVTGQGSNVGLIGSYVNPSGGAPALYPQPLYFQGAPFLNNGWRIGFRTYVQPRPVCLSDFNSDGGVDGDDIASFIEAWEYGTPQADVSQDGGVDGSDLYEFFVLWEGAAC